MNKLRSVGVVLFKDFELLDVFGPLEMYGMLPENFEIFMVAEDAGEIASKQGPKSVAEYRFCENRQYDILLVPGGWGTRNQVKNPILLEWLIKQSPGAEYVTSVCTGSALLAQSGLLEGVKATTNKEAFSWVTSHGAMVHWQKEARWVEDGKFFTSSGVSAGMDMSLALIGKLLGQETAVRVSISAEYDWHNDASWDPFAKIHGLV